MKVNKVFPILARVVDFGDKISKGCKTGANISIGEGGLILANDMHSIILLVEHPEFNEEIAFKSHLFPEAEPPLLIKDGDKEIDFTWKERGVKKNVNVPSCGNLYEKGKKVVDKHWKMENTFRLPVDAFKVIDEDIHVLKIERNEEGLIFEQMKTNGDEIFTNEIALKSGMGGLLDAVGDDDDFEEAKTITSTVEFAKLPELTDESGINLCIAEDGKIFGQILMGSLNAKLIISPMKYER